MGTAIGLSMHPMYIHLSTSIWTIKSCLNTQEIAHYSSLLIQNTPMKFQSNFIRNTHKIKQLRLQYIQMVIQTIASSETKEDCSWGHFAAEDGHHKWFVYSQVSTHFLTWEWDLLHLSKDFLLQRLLQSCGTEPEAVTCTWQCPLAQRKKNCLTTQLWTAPVDDTADISAIKVYTSRSNSHLQDCTKDSTIIWWR
jgi:hypothetical protein